MESDSGIILPTGLQFTGSDKARAIMKEVMSLLQPLNVTNLFSDGEGTDIDFWIQAGVPGKTKSEDDIPVLWSQWLLAGSKVDSDYFHNWGGSALLPLCSPLSKICRE